MFPRVVTVLGALSIVAASVSVLLWMAAATRAGRGLLARWFGRGGRELLTGAWLVAFVAMTGSLYMSSSGLEPCEFCWYQRIAMYPLVAVLGVGVLRRDLGVWRYTLPLSLIGLGLSVYHAIIQLQPDLSATECSLTAPCTLRYFAVFGWISIPWMAGAAFLWITTLVSLAALLARSSDPPAQASAHP